jgi:hypothetical protein
VHCDVRPANIVIVGDAAVLVDWGCSCACGDNARGRGVAAYADARIFAPTTTSFSARPSQDVAGALYTWAAIACDAGCAAPWLALPPAAAAAHGPFTLADMPTRREAWLEGATARGDFPAPLAAALVTATTGAGADSVGIIACARAAVATVAAAT